MISKNITKKKTNEKIEDELLNFLRENDEFEETSINIANTIYPRGAIELIKNYE